jgi:hypothetical protein
VIIIVSRDLPVIKAKLKELGTGTKQLAYIRRTAQAKMRPVERIIDQYTVAVLPHRGGLGEWVAKAPLKISVRTGARSAGIRLIMGRNSRGGRSDLQGINAGKVRHPTYGHRGGKVRHAVANPSGFGRHFFVTQRMNDWHDQGVEPGFFDVPIEGAGVDKVREAAEEAIAKVITELGLG